MNRQVLRELGLYPLWQRREMPVVQNVPAVGANLFARAEGRVDKQIASMQNKAANDAVRPESVEGLSSDAETPSTLPIAEGQGAPTLDENRANKFAPTVTPSTATSPAVVALASESTFTDWAELHPQIESCQLCDLHAGCLQTVCGTGDPEADWLFVGDWSSEEDDVQGEPFMGAAGKLLDNMLRAISLNRQQNVYLTNVLKCRPPEQHHSLSSEIAQCLPYLQLQIELIKPKKIIALGNTAAHALLGGNAPLKTLRGQVHHYQKIPVIVTYHPAYLLRSPLEKSLVWTDLCLAKTLD